jgi:hypothetical protein
MSFSPISAEIVLQCTLATQPGPQGLSLSLFVYAVP